jgi:hypothetical protein
MGFPEVKTVVNDSVRVKGQTVVETGTVIVLTGQSLMPGPQVQMVTSLVTVVVDDDAGKYSTPEPLGATAAK